jgi:peptide/nickel transport system substrate-binding protein
MATGRRVLLVVTAMVIALAVAACDSGGGGAVGDHAGAAPQQGGTLRYGAGQFISTFNIYTSEASGVAEEHILVRVLPHAFFITPTFTLQHDNELLTTEPTATVVDGKQVVTFKLNPAAVWSDGVPINADDFRYLWKSIETKGFDVGASPGYHKIASVTGVGADKKTVVVTFAKPFADWRALFGDILPAHYMIAQERKYGGPAGAWSKAIKSSLPVSGGPWKVASLDTVRQVVTLVRNDQYWGRKPYLDRIVYQTLQDSAQQPAALKNGEVDTIYSQPQLDLVKQIKALAPAVTSQVNFALAFEHLDMNTQNRFLSDINIRRAIAYGIDRAAIAKAGPAQFDARAQVLNNRIWMNNQPQYRDNSGDYAARNVSKAKQLLAQSGYTIGSDGYASKGGNVLSLRFSTTAGNKLRENTGILIQSQLEDIGIKVVMDNVPSTELFGDRLPNGNFDLALLAFAGSPFPSDQYAVYHSATTADRQTNFGLLSDPRIDRLADQAVGELDPTKVAADWNQIDAYAWQDMVTIPLYQKPDLLAYRSTFGGIADNASTQGPFWNSPGFHRKR